MSAQRLFLIAPSLARLIQRERGGERVREGYFPDQPDRNVFIQVEETRSSLVLSFASEASPEERADIPVAQAQALLSVTPGQVEYVRTRLALGSREIQALHFLSPGRLDLVAVGRAPEGEQDCHPLPWFGPEVSAEAAYKRRRIALDGLPDTPEVDLTDAALNSLLDLLENRSSAQPSPHQVAAMEEPAHWPSAYSSAPAPIAGSDGIQDEDEPGIEDDVIRELAQALRPQKS
jgi:CYTH domain-containing protein